MKKIYTLLLLLSVTIGFAQIPAGYYNTATGTGYALKTQLYNIIKTHTTLTYSPGLWNLYPYSDAKPAPNTAQVWDTYSNCNMLFGTVANGGNQDNGTAGSNPCERFNREHTVPKSWFGGINALPMATDAFIVMPTDKKINGLRGSYCYGIVGTNTISAAIMAYTTCKLGNNVAPNCPAGMTVFEPADEFKGDFARNYFYMATCYENSIASWQNIDANGAKFFDGTNTSCYQSWALNMLYQWHLADPVSQKEIDRNNAIYYNVNGQGNRNPFIDHPEWVQVIWSANLAADSFDMASVVKVYPNPSNDHRINIDSEASLDKIELINVNGQLMQQIKNPVSQNHTYTLENLAQGFYFLKLSSNDKTITKKVVIN